MIEQKSSPLGSFFAVCGLNGFTRWWRGVERCCGKAKFSFACQKRTRKAPATFEAREARIKGYSPLIIPEELSKRKKASRFAKTGCGAQRPLRALSGTRVLLTAAPTAPPCIRRRRWSSLLHFFLVSPTCCFAAGVTPLQGVKFSRDVKSSAEP